MTRYKLEVFNCIGDYFHNFYDSLSFLDFDIFVLTVVANKINIHLGALIFRIYTQYLCVT